MGRSYKNFWSLNVDEAVVTGILRDARPKNTEVFMPMNAEMKDVDLVFLNTKSQKMVTIQVKGSRAYEPTAKDKEEHGEGSTGWFVLNKSSILETSSLFFIFLIYVFVQKKKSGRMDIEHHTLTIPTEELRTLCSKHKKADKNGKFMFYFWINPYKKIADDIRVDAKNKKYNLTKYLDKAGIERLRKMVIS